jgi:hypothetical protein
MILTSITRFWSSFIVVPEATVSPTRRPPRTAGRPRCRALGAQGRGRGHGLRRRLGPTLRPRHGCPARRESHQGFDEYRGEDRRRRSRLASRRDRRDREATLATSPDNAIGQGDVRVGLAAHLAPARAARASVRSRWGRPVVHNLAGDLSDTRRATMKIRFLRCGAPTSRAPSGIGRLA